MGAFLIYPIITMVADSFFDIGLTGDRTFVGIDNYIRAFTAGGFLKQLKNTLLYIVIAVGVETLLGLLFALLFEVDYKGSKIIRSFMMAPLMIAPLVAGLTWKLMMSSSFGIVNELLARIGVLSSSSDILWLADEKWSLIACCIAVPGLPRRARAPHPRRQRAGAHGQGDEARAAGRAGVPEPGVDAVPGGRGARRAGRGLVEQALHLARVHAQAG